MSNQFIGETLASKYRIDSVLRDADGSDSNKLYLATHLLMDKPVSVKILAPELASDEAAVKDFSSEARTASRVAHPNILNVTDFGSDVNGTVYTVLEDASGETLEEAIEENGKFTPDRAVRIGWQIAAALAAAHAADIVHGHLSDKNILLATTPGSAETVKILNLGALGNEKNPAFDDERNLKGLAYCAPEQNAANAVDARFDIYSLGVILYQMLAGEVPFAADAADELRLKQTQNPPTPLAAFRADLPEALESVVLKALAVNPEMRYQTASEFANALNGATNNVGGAQTILISEPSDNATNNLWKTAFIVLIGISMLAVGLIYATSVKQTDVQTQLQADANGQPVQPINPATGMNEQGLSQMMPYAGQPGAVMPGGVGATGMPTMPQPAIPNGDGFGDGYNAWGSGRPPAGAPPPQYVPPGGTMVTIPGEGGSVFMPNENGTGYYMVPVNPNANAQPQPSPKTGKSPLPANTAPQPSPTPAAGAQQTAPPTEAAKPTPAPKTEKAPAKPAATPKPDAPKTPAPPASTGKGTPSGADENS